ncbi:hypothetical protein [Dysgonomonas capnocytophagoides]|uniref:hypothetical protein n=1 Tax=Dysgonomonas capnocytophagoides TaxID=45254 RepID=UPI003993329A
MKDDNINMDIQLGIDAISQTVEEINRKLSNQSNLESSLTADLLNKISETIEYAKKAIDEEDLKKFLNIVISVTTELQERANKVSAEFLNQKVAEINELTKQPSVVINRYSIDFKSSKTFLAISILCLCIGISLYFNYNQLQENNRLKQNDIKYRYVQMKGGVSYDDIIYLNRSYTTIPYYRDSIENKIVEFESLVRQKAYNESVKEQNEKDNKQINKKLKELTQ